LDNQLPEPILKRWGPVTAVVLAAGQSSRMGQAKQLAVVAGEPMVIRAVKTALQSGAQEVIVVVGAYAEAVTQALSGLSAMAGPRLRLIDNPAYASGQASSMKCAVRACSPATRAILFLPVDQPFAPPVLLRRLIRTWQQGAHIAAPLVEGQLRGAPAIFDRALFPELLQVTGDVGARVLLQKYRDEVVGLPTAAELLCDLDTPEDLAAIN
jgi:molybdenum cofactor cytidylyltransferase